MSEYYTRAERLEIILTIVKQLQNFKMKNGNKVNLYNGHMCSFVNDFKQISQDYITQNDEEPTKLKDFSGSLDFEEIQKKSEYVLPVQKSTNPLFVIRM